MSWFNPNRYGGNPYGSGGYGLHGNPHADKYLSPKQREAAEKLMPEILFTSDNASNLAEQGSVDREIQRKLMNTYNIVDFSKEGKKAYNTNCKIVHNFSDYMNTLPEKRD